MFFFVIFIFPKKIVFFLYLFIKKWKKNEIFREPSKSVAEAIFFANFIYFYFITQTFVFFYLSFVGFLFIFSFRIICEENC